MPLSTTNKAANQQYKSTLLLPLRRKKIYDKVTRIIIDCDECSTWAQFCCKLWGGSLVWKQWSHRVDGEVKFYKYRFPILFKEVF